MRVIQKYRVSLGTQEIIFPAYVTVLSTASVRSDVAYTVPTVDILVETFVDEPSNRPDKHTIKVIRTGEQVPDGFAYVGTVPHNWDEVHVYDKREPL